MRSSAAAILDRRVRARRQRKWRATKKYSEEAEDLLTAMHEVIGHGSGKLTRADESRRASFLKEYYSTLEEARADLMGLWNIWDPKLKELGLVKDQDEVAKAMYDNAARAPLTQLRRIPKGDTHRGGSPA